MIPQGRTKSKQRAMTPEMFKQIKIGDRIFVGRAAGEVIAVQITVCRSRNNPGSRNVSIQATVQLEDETCRYPNCCYDADGISFVQNLRGVTV